MPSSPGLADAAGLPTRLEAAEQLIGELREGMAVIVAARRRELEARDMVIAGQAETIARLERRQGRDSPRPPSPAARSPWVRLTAA